MTSFKAAMVHQHYFCQAFLTYFTLLIVAMSTQQRVYGYKNFSAHIYECKCMENTTCLPVNIVFETLGDSVVECSMQCQPRTNCLAFYYHPEDKRCVGCNNIYIGQIYKPLRNYYGNRHYRAGIPPMYYQYLGCYIDRQWPNGVFRDKAITDISMSSSFCFNHCLGKLPNTSTMYFGLQQGNQCYCGPFDVNYKAFGTPNYGGCNTPCAGNSSQACGGNLKNSIYMIIPVA